MNLDVMLVGASRGLYYAIERMGKTNGGSGGRIINTASMAGLYISTSLLVISNSSGIQLYSLIKLIYTTCKISF